MTDILTKRQRSYNMSQIKSKWTTPELIIHNKLKGYKIAHKMHPKIKGNPDIILLKSKTAIFIDGCFWHKCPKCFIEPATNKEFWSNKINKNRIRDFKNNQILRKNGWAVMHIWEHQIKNGIKITDILIS